MVNYVDLAKTAGRLLTSFGQDAVFSRTSGATFNPTTGSFTGGTVTQFTSKAARFDYNVREIDGENILRDDFRLIVEVNGGTPEVDDDCLFNSTNYRVMSVKTLSPSGEDIYYELQLRR